MGSDDSASPWAKRGFAGKLGKTRTTAPENATEDEIQQVALIAFREERDPSEVWREARNAELSEFGGGSDGA